MHPILCRILEKPVCAILDSCNDLFVKLNNVASSLFGPSQPKCSLLLKSNIKNPANEKPKPPKKPQRGIMRKPVISETKDLTSSYDYDHLYQTDSYHRHNCTATEDNKLCVRYETVQWVPSMPKWLITLSDLFCSLIQEVLPSKGYDITEGSELDDSVVLVSRPSDQYKYLLRLVGIYPYPLLIDEKEDDGYILVDGDGDDKYP